MTAKYVTATDSPKIDWNHVYLLGSENGLTTWDDRGFNQPLYVNVVVIGGEPPLCTARPHPDTRLELLDGSLTHEEKVTAAHERGGVYAFGWYLPEGFKRACRDCKGAAPGGLMLRAFRCDRCNSTGRDPEDET